MPGTQLRAAQLMSAHGAGCTRRGQAAGAASPRSRGITRQARQDDARHAARIAGAELLLEQEAAAHGQHLAALLACAPRVGWQRREEGGMAWWAAQLATPRQDGCQAEPTHTAGRACGLQASHLPPSPRAPDAPPAPAAGRWNVTYAGASASAAVPLTARRSALSGPSPARGGGSSGAVSRAPGSAAGCLERLTAHCAWREAFNFARRHPTRITPAPAATTPEAAGVGADSAGGAGSAPRARAAASWRGPLAGHWARVSRCTALPGLRAAAAGEAGALAGLRGLRRVQRSTPVLNLG